MFIILLPPTAPAPVPEHQCGAPLLWLQTDPAQVKTMGTLVQISHPAPKTLGFPMLPALPSSAEQKFCGTPFKSLSTTTLHFLVCPGAWILLFNSFFPLLVPCTPEVVHLDPSISSLKVTAARRMSALASGCLCELIKIFRVHPLKPVSTLSGP